MRIFSGIQPTGALHLGNYLGAIRQYVELQDPKLRGASSELQKASEADEAPSSLSEAVYCIVDLHALTTLPDPTELRSRIYDTAALLYAAGLDPKKSTLFLQSMRPEHAELAWIMECLATMGELGRMTQYKEKSTVDRQLSTVDTVRVGLFTYPALMAADILLYQTDVVPVGDDQTQHVELARDLAKRFNQRYPSRQGEAEAGGDTFVVPKLQLKKDATRIMGLDDPTVKMSKSASSSYNYIALMDDAETIRKKIQRAVTDSGSEITYSSDKPALKNLLTIYAGLTGEVPDGIVNRYAGRGYAEFKADLAEVIMEHLKPIQHQFAELRPDESTLRMLLHEGAQAIAPLAAKTLAAVKNQIGLVR